MEMPALPLIFDTTPELGATKLHAACLYPLLHPRERFGTLAVVVDFSPFWAGKFRRRAKIACAILSTIACRRLPGNSKRQGYEREGYKNEGRARGEISGGGRDFGRENKILPGKGRDMHPGNLEK